MIAVSTSLFNIARLRKKNVWYTVKDGNWTDPAIWQCEALNKGSVYYTQLFGSTYLQELQEITYPNNGDDVIIGHNVTYTSGVYQVTYALSNVIVTSAGSLKIAAIGQSVFQINNSFQCDGTLDLSTGGSGATIYLSGSYNRIANALLATNSTVVYNGANDQNVLPLSYGNLTITGTNGGAMPTIAIPPTRYIQANTTIAGNLAIDGSSLELGVYNLTVNGTTNLNGGGGINKSGSGSVLFVGKFNGANSGSWNSLNFSGGNPTVEFRGGFTTPYYDNTDQIHFKTGTSIWTFSTNNQSIISWYGNAYEFDCTILISGTITVTVQNVGSSAIQFNNTVNGNNTGSTLNNGGRIYLNTTSTPMSTGIFNYQYGGATTQLGYVFDGNFTLPYSTYGSLLISGSGTKSLFADTTLSGTLTLSTLTANNSILDVASYDFIVTGSSNFTGATGMIKSAPGGDITFIGLVDHLTQGSGSYFDFSASNPNVEIRGGMNLPYGLASQFKSGTGVWTFSTNNQTVNGGYNTTHNYNGPVVISGPITVIFTSQSGGYTFFNTGIDGDNVSAVMDCRLLKVGSSAVGIYFNYLTAPMSTGKLYANQVSNNAVYYSYSGNQDITTPSDPISPSYQNLTFSGSGAKRLLGNVSVKGTYTLISPATLNANGFTLTNP